MTVSKIPFNDTSRVYVQHAAEIDAAIQQTVKSGWWLMGKQTKEFATAFADYCGVKHCLPVANGSDALEIALRATLGNRFASDHEVITVANAGGYTTTACRLIGLTPVYADICRENLLLDIDSLINCLGPKVIAIVVTHLFGGVVDVSELRKRLQLNGYQHVSIIEDCAQAHGAILNGKKVGSLGDLATFSFYPTKNLGAMGDAGAIVTNNTTLYELLSRLHQYGWTQKYEVSSAYGRNSRMDEIQAAVLKTLIPHLESFNTRRKSIYSAYANGIATSTDKVHPLLHGDLDFVAHLAVFRTSNRNEMRRFFAEKGITTDIHYPILDHEQPAWRSMPMRIDSESQLTCSQAVQSEIVSLPCFPAMTDEEVGQVCEVLSAWGDVTN